MILRKALFAGVAAASALAIVPAAPAQAVSAGTCSLTVTGTGYHEFRNVTVTCVPRAGGDVMAAFKIFGEDPLSDDLMYVVETKKLRFSFRTHVNYINEDFPDWDELYAMSWLRRPDGSLYRIRSNEVHGSWGNGTWKPPTQRIVDKS
jgi:hypothetical protein